MTRFPEAGDAGAVLRAEPRFIADAALGRLARYLRMLGCDVVYVRAVGATAALGEALRTGRVLLTKRREVATRAGAAGFWVAPDKIREQLAATARRYHLTVTARVMSRCLECNEVLLSVAKRDVWERLPPHVRATQDRFMTCPSCGRVYWPGTHYARAVARLADIIRAVESDNQDLS